MLNSSPSVDVVPLKSFGINRSSSPTLTNETLITWPAPLGESRGHRVPRDQQSIDTSFSAVDVVPHRVVTRTGMTWRGVGIEFVSANAGERVDYSFHSSLHLLAAYQQGVRRDGKSYVEGLPRSTRREVAKKLTLVPAGHRYHEWHDPQEPTGVTYFYFSPAKLQIDADEGSSNVLFAPRLFFEDDAIWNTVAKLRQAVEAPEGANKLYVEALGVILIHELVRLNCVTPHPKVAVKGGLAAWQQRLVATYIEENLSKQIPIVALSRLARLSTFHFCRAFKQSFGVPPHRYHTNRRIERAKVMLGERHHSVTEIGLTVGFSETSSFTAAFRKITGQTPSRYYRALG